MLTNLPDVCQGKVLRFLDEETLSKLKQSNKAMYSKIKTNRNKLIGRKYEELGLDFTKLHDSENPIEATFELTIKTTPRKSSPRLGTTTEREKTIRVLHNKSVEAVRFQAGPYDDITGKAAIMEGERVYAVRLSTNLRDITVFTDNVRLSAEGRMKEELQNTHIERLQVKQVDFSTKVVEVFLKIPKLTVDKLTLYQPIIEENGVPFVRLLRHMAAQTVDIKMGQDTNINMIFDNELIEFLPSLQAFYCSGIHFTENADPKEMDIPAVPPATLLPQSITIGVESFRKIIQDWYNGRCCLTQVVASTSVLSITDFAEFLDVPHSLVDNSVISIVSTTGERCTIIQKYLVDQTSGWCVRVKEHEEGWF